MLEISKITFERGHLGYITWLSGVMPSKSHSSPEGISHCFFCSDHQSVGIGVPSLTDLRLMGKLLQKVLHELWCCVMDTLVCPFSLHIHRHLSTDTFSVWASATFLQGCLPGLAVLFPKRPQSMTALEKLNSRLQMKAFSLAYSPSYLIDAS